jgi:tetratricopeptide (TPR) repeat protein
MEGLLLLHSFEYEDARTAFQRAQAADSTMLMAYWGEAMTHNHPLWRQQEIEEGQAALAKLAPTTAERLALAKTSLERDFLAAVELLYQEKGTKQERDQQYANRLSKMQKKYPEQQEVAAFYALSLLGAVPLGRDDEAYEKAARVAQGVMAENPQHPGALHYIIHAYDDPAHAAKAIPAANTYARVAPSAAHALHMPSHIYVSMGMWEEVIQSNIASWQASVQRMKKKKMDNNARSYHALHWRLYALTQQGRYAEASEMIEELKRYTAEEPNRGTRSYMVTIPANYLVETNDWKNETVWLIDPEREDLNILNRAIRQFTEGVRAYRNKDEDALAAMLQQMARERKDASNRVTASGAPMCSTAGSNRSLPNQLDIDQSQVLALELEAMQAQLKGNLIEAERLLVAATELEQSITYSYGPPRIVQPSYELYGRWLLEQGRPTEALVQFDYALAKGPGRLHALAGALQAAEAVRDTERATALYQELRINLAKADQEVRARYLSEEMLSAI